MELKDRDDIILNFKGVRSLTEKLCDPLEAEDFVISLTQDTSPPKWHLAHTSWFFENFILQKYLESYRAFSHEFSFLFNSYYRTVGEFIPKIYRSGISRPTIDEVRKYREYISSHMTLLLENADRGLFERIKSLVQIGINHEQQHQELLLMDIKQNFYFNPTRPIYTKRLQAEKSTAPSGKYIDYHAEKVAIGHNPQDGGFAYDNESGFHHQWVENFSLATNLVTNGEFLQFMEDGGYKKSIHWLSDGWDWKEKENIASPLYWIREEEEWLHYTLHGLESLPLDSPVVHVSYYEAQAYANWKGGRLPTEFEWELAGQREKVHGQFLEDMNLGPTNLNKDGLIHQIHGTVWEWTQSAYLPYPKYHPPNQETREYNEKFMCNQMVLRGGSAITPRTHYRHTYRNFYYPHMRWQYAGIRLARDVF